MLTTRQLFFQHVALPSQFPIGIEIERASGIYMYSPDGKKYIDLVSGVSVNNLGHSHPAIVEAVKKQLDLYMHLMVYGEMIQTPQVKMAELLASVLPAGLNSTYFVSSGSEAVDGALKLAKRYTGRTGLVGFKNAYHGGTHGAFSMLGCEEIKYSYRPLLPDVRFLNFNNFDDLQHIDQHTACVLVEPVQAEAGVIVPQAGFLEALRKRCNESGALLIFDEIQTGFGRTGKLFALEHQDAVPDILCLAKGMGGGMPVGAFISSKEIMLSLTCNPDFGHITTFGGHPVSAAAALANLRVLTEQKDLIGQADEKGKMFEDALATHPQVVKIRRKGLMISVELKDIDTNNKAMKLLLSNGLVVDPFFFMPQAFRIAPPLIITFDEIEACIRLLKKSLDTL